MTKGEFLQLMCFPTEWETLGMYPQELFECQSVSIGQATNEVLSTIAMAHSIGGYVRAQPRVRSRVFGA